MAVLARCANSRTCLVRGGAFLGLAMGAVDRAISEIERLIGDDVQVRNIAPLASYARGSLAAAAASIARHPRPHIAILTGFYLGYAEPPNCETDGPPGAVMLAAGFAAARVPCRLVTDLVSAGVLRATAAAAGGPGLPIEVVAMSEDGAGGSIPIARLTREWLAADPPITHVIAIERCGPSRDGRPRDARGVDITAVNAPLDRLFSAGPWTTIGIGDLGNEIGMGSLPYDLVARSVPRGDQLWCTAACDHAIVCGISNWAGAALLGAILLLRPRRFARLLSCITPEFARRLLEAAVRDGDAVSGDGNSGPPRPWLAVDGLSWSEIEPTFRGIHEICRNCLALAGEGVETEM